MAKEEEPILMEDDDDQVADTREQKRTSGGTEIPNYRGKIIETEGAENRGPMQVQWTEDDDETGSEDETSDVDEEEEEEEDKDKDGAEVSDKGTTEVRKQRRRAKVEEDSEDEEVLEEEEIWDFPRDDEGWTEADLGEEWADPTPADDTVGRDPELTEDDPELIAKLEKEGRAPPNRPYYVPYRKNYPPIPDDHPDIETPHDVVEELERMEEFLVWASYVFADGSSYEGTVWDDLAHGRGVYTTPLELCKYEGEWFQNMMEGHGVLEVDVPTMNPPPDSELEKKMRAEGHMLAADFMPPEDREWLKMDIEDTFEIYPEALKAKPFEESDLWLKYYGQKPEKGHYKYAGQWKHSRMHGCGVYSLNGRQIWGKFYFGDLLPDIEECTAEMSAVHASLAEVAAAKARMFVNKPDGMVREVKGPYNDPQHPYMYEEEDIWMAPGFINEFHKVPEVWQKYVKEVDQERQMWLNSYIKSPLRIPMPAELEHMWSDRDEFVVLGNTPSSALQYDPDNLLRGKEECQGELLLHVPTGQLINWVTDPDGNVRMFLQPFREDGSVDPEAAIPLPLGFDEFMGEGEGEDGDGKEGEKILTETEKRQKKWEEEDKKRKEKWIQQDIDRAERQLQEDAEFLQKVYEEMAEEKLKDLALEEKFALQLLDDEEGPGTALEDESGPSDKPAADDSEPAGDNKAGDATAGKKPLPEESEGREGGDEDEDEEDEDDGKPTSFGKVALVDPGMTKPSTCRSSESNGPRFPPFPTVFASLSLLPQLGFRPALKSIVGSTLRTVRSRINSVFKQHVPSSPSQSNSFVDEQVMEKSEIRSSTAAPVLPRIEAVSYQRVLSVACRRAAVRTSFNVLLVDPTRKSGGQLHRNVPASAWALSGFSSYRTLPDKPHRQSSRGRRARQRLRVPQGLVTCRGVDGPCADASILAISVPIVQ